jgi:hypothetical protein
MSEAEAAVTVLAALDLVNLHDRAVADLLQPGGLDYLGSRLVCSRPWLRPAWGGVLAVTVNMIAGFVVAMGPTPVVPTDIFRSGSACGRRPGRPMP